MKKHKIKKGECFASLAKEYGFHDPDIIYSDALNATLKSKRPNLHVLNPKDLVKIPDKPKKQADLSPGTTPTFVVKGVVTAFKIVVEDFDGNALATKPYELDVDGEKFEGTTDGSGLIEHKIDAESTKGELTVYLDDEKTSMLTWPLSIGGLSCHEDLAGVQSRLNNLGYYCANEKGTNDKSTKASVRAFKQKHALADNDTVDQAMKDKLLAEYGF